MILWFIGFSRVFLNIGFTIIGTTDFGVEGITCNQKQATQPPTTFLDQPPCVHPLRSSDFGGIPVCPYGCACSAAERALSCSESTGLLMLTHRWWPSGQRVHIPPSSHWLNKWTCAGWHWLAGHRAATYSLYLSEVSLPKGFTCLGIMGPITLLYQILLHQRFFPNNFEEIFMKSSASDSCLMKRKAQKTQRHFCGSSVVPDLVVLHDLIFFCSWMHFLLVFFSEHACDCDCCHLLFLTDEPIKRAKPVSRCNINYI
jgi:hypothetical protein